MNRTAKGLGMTGSRFMRPSGATVYSFSTAYDLYLLQCAFNKNVFLRGCCATARYEVNGRSIVNSALSNALSILTPPPKKYL